MKGLIGAALFACGLISIISAFRWAAFDLIWWEPIGYGDPRGTILALIHLFAGIGGLIGATLIADH